MRYFAICIMILVAMSMMGQPAHAWGSKKYKQRIAELEKQLAAQPQVTGSVCSSGVPETEGESRKMKGLQTRLAQLEKKQAANQQKINDAQYKDQEMAKLKQEIKRLKKQLAAYEKQ